MVMSLSIGFGRGLLDGELARDATLRERVDAVADAEQLGQLRRDHDDALPGGGQPVDDRVDLVLRAHVDAARRLVEDEHVGIGVDPLRQHDLLLVAARELAGLHQHARRLDVHRLAVLVRDLVLLVVVDEAVLLELLQRRHRDVALDVLDEVEAVGLAVLGGVGDAVVDRLGDRAGLDLLAAHEHLAGDLRSVAVAEQAHRELGASGAHEARRCRRSRRRAR